MALADKLTNLSPATPRGKAFMEQLSPEEKAEVEDMFRTYWQMSPSQRPAVEAISELITKHLERPVSRTTVARWLKQYQ